MEREASAERCEASSKRSARLQPSGAKLHTEGARGFSRAAEPSVGTWFASIRRMPRRLLGGALVAAAVSAAYFGCSPTLQPTTVPTPANPAFDPFKAALQTYVDQTQPFRREAAQQGERIPGKSSPEPAAEQAVRTRQ